MLPQHDPSFEPHNDLFYAGFEHDRNVYEQMTHYQSTADIANFVLRLYFRDKVSEANHCVHD